MNDQQVFLATTALEDFWDTSKPIVFLGEWCKRFSRKSVWEKLNTRMVTSTCNDNLKIKENQQVLKALYEKILSVLARSLNTLHGINASNRYWRILIGPWLNNYLCSVHDRVLMLQAAKNQFPNFSTLLLSEESFVTPNHSNDFNWLIIGDAYNLQIITKILSFWGENFSKKPLEVKAKPLQVKQESFLKKMKMNILGSKLPSFMPRKTIQFAAPRGQVFLGIKKLLKLPIKVFQKGIKNLSLIILERSYFSNGALFQLFLKTRGILWPHFHDQEILPQFTLEKEKRAQLSSSLLAASESEFERLLATLLPEDIPQSFVEAFQYLRDKTAKEYPRRPKVIFSANAWYYNDGFQQWAASQAENGVPLIGTQHGGNYGSLLHHPSEEHELTILDQYYTWGWKNGSPKIKPFFSTKLSTRKKMKINPKEKGILFVTTIIPRYNDSFYFNFDHYLLEQSRFIKCLPFPMHQHLRARLHYVDFGWDMVRRWKDFAPDVMLENWSVPFLESLKKCRLYVCDHLSTTFIESLVAEKPTILFWNFDANLLRPEAIPFYENLCSVGILHRSPESAANHLISVYDDVGAWWNENKCREVRQKFCYEFGRTSENALQEWAEEFKGMVHKDFLVSESCLRKN